jgi:hypothetical protein
MLAPSSLRLAFACASLVASGCDAVRGGGLPSLDNFEGELEFLTQGSFAEGSAQPVPVIVFVKDDKLRFDPPESTLNGGGSFLIDSPAKRMFVINTARKEAMQFDLSVASTKPPGAAPVVTKTGRKTKVAGFTCEDWDIALPSQRKEVVCVADKGASFLNVPLTGGMLGSRAWLREVLDGSHVPLRLVAYDKTGVESGRIELTRITRKAEDVDLFSVPPSFQTVDIASLLSGKGAPPRTGGGDSHDATKIQARPAHS